MFCPFCRAEYRAGFTKCSDCVIPLVESLPQSASDPDFFVILWNGESLPFLEEACAELDGASILVAIPRTEILLRDPADRYHLRSIKAFPYMIGVRKSDFPVARATLLGLVKTRFPQVPMPPENAYPEPFAESPQASRSSGADPKSHPSVLLWTSDDLKKIEFLESSLSGLDILWRRLAAEDGHFQILVRSRDERTARGILRDITEDPALRPQLPEEEKDLWQDNPPRSYFLAWFLAAFYFFITFSAFLNLGTDRPTPLTAVVTTLAVGLDTVGKFWMMYQAIHYEMRSFRYCLMTLVPFTWVWYFVERYQTRRGSEKLPLAVRLRERPPLA